MPGLMNWLNHCSASGFERGITPDSCASLAKVYLADFGWPSAWSTSGAAGTRAAALPAVEKRAHRRLGFGVGAKFGEWNRELLVARPRHVGERRLDGDRALAELQRDLIEPHPRAVEPAALVVAEALDR